MTIDRRQILGLFAASAATALAGCGGGGGDDTPPTRFIWVLNVNPEFPAADVTIGATTVAQGLPFQALTSRIEAQLDTYSFSFRERSNSFTQTFNGVRIDNVSPAVSVFYRYPGTGNDQSRLSSLPPPGIINYFDSSVSLDVDLFDDVGGVQLETLAFEKSKTQVSRSANCTLRLYAAGSNVKVYDSGLQQRTDSILIVPRFPAASARAGEVAVVGLNYSLNSSSAVVWANTLG